MKLICIFKNTDFFKNLKGNSILILRFKHVTDFHELAVQKLVGIHSFIYDIKFAKRHSPGIPSTMSPWVFGQRAVILTPSGKSG